MNLAQKLLLRLNRVLVRSSNLDTKLQFLRGVLGLAAADTVPVDRGLLYKRFYDEMRARMLVGTEERTRCYGWFKLVEQLQGVEGCFVEAGVGYGNTLFTLAAANQFFHSLRLIYGFDSFAGFPPPTTEDLGPRVKALHKIKGWGDNSVEGIVALLKAFNEKAEMKVDLEQLRFVPGFFEDTMPTKLPDKIAFLHLDCDMYAGTKHVLEVCYPRLQPGAFVILDEYHDARWPGVRKAMDEFTAPHGIKLDYHPELLRYGFQKN